jgi:16S rRNA processing protein RimM
MARRPAGTRDAEGRTPEPRVCVAAVAGAQGVRGWVRLKTFTERPEDALAYGALQDEPGTRVFRMKRRGLAKGLLVAEVEGVTDRDAAAALRGTRLYVPRGALPPPEEDEFYHADLIGLAVEDAAGKTLGRVRALYDFGAGDVLEVADAQGGLSVLPFTKAVVPTVDLAGGRLVVVPPAEIEAEIEAGPEAGSDGAGESEESHGNPGDGTGQNEGKGP